MILPVSSAYLELCLADNRLLAEGVSVKQRVIGSLLLPTGKLVASDALVLRTDPFAIVLPRGTFPVSLAVADLGSDERVAFASVRFGSDPVTRWRALPTSSDSTPLEPDEITGFGVDSGTACFADEAVVTTLTITNSEQEYLAYSDAMIAGFDKAQLPSWTHHTIAVPPGNLVGFSAGFGDGVYATYVGFAADGRVSVVTTDFGVLPLL